MQPAMAALQALFILFLMGACGWLLRSRRVIAPATLAPLTALALDIALPCLVFAVILKRFTPAAIPDWRLLPLAWVAFTAAALPLSLAAGWAARPEVRREFRFCCFYQNALFFPLAILVEMFGADAGIVAQLFLMTFLFPAFFFNTSAVFISGRWRAEWRKTLHPVLLTTAAAMLLSLAGAADRVPGVLLKTAEQLGAAAVPLLMIVLGARIREDYERRGPVYWREMLAFVGLRNAVFPLLLLAALPLLGLPHNLAFLLLLQAAMPPITAAPLVIAREGGNAPFASQLLLASYLAALATLPVALWLFSLVAPP